MKIEKGDILTPANVATIAGLVLTVHGATEIDNIIGVIEVGSGRILDILDGPIARRTHASRLGAALDATCDKLAVFSILLAVWHYGIAPEPLIGLIAAQNIVNGAVSLYAEHRNREMESSAAGKRAMFLQNLFIAGYALANLLNTETLRAGLEAAGLIAGLSGLAVGAAATCGYIRHAFAKD